LFVNRKYIQHRIGTSDRFFKYSTVLLGSKNYRGFLDQLRSFSRRALFCAVM